MKEIDNRLVEWAIKETETHYKDQVSILLEHNTYCLEEDKNVRYVNSIISDSKEYIGLARTFIVNGNGYDINQLSWESFERDAEVKGYYVTILAEANILYSKNEADKQRFLYLRAKFFANLQNSEYMFERGLEWLNNAMDVYKTLLFEEEFSKVRKGAGFIGDYLAVAVACYNQTYFKSFTKLQELNAMKYLPNNFIEQYKQIVRTKTVSELQSLCHEIIKTTRDFFKMNDKRVRENKVAPDYGYLAYWYQECSYYFKRIYYFCANNEAELAFDGSFHIQTDLDEIAKDFNISNLDIISNFDVSDLSGFAKKVKQAEENIVAAIKSNNMKIDSYSSVDEFIIQNS
jgi:hypothetical protein